MRLATSVLLQYRAACNAHLRVNCLIISSIDIDVVSCIANTNAPRNRSTVEQIRHQLSARIADIVKSNHVRPRLWFSPLPRYAVGLPQCAPYVLEPVGAASPSSDSATNDF